jgi:ABC-type nitrate/sulfonate/bicarbonate transport system permease component
MSQSLRAIVERFWLPAALIALWWFATRNSTSFYFPPLSDILATLWNDLVAGPLPRDLAVSLTNLGAGIAIATVLGIAFGLVIGQLEFVRQITAPALNFFRAMPPASIVPIVIIAMGVGPAPKIFIIAMTCFWPILLNTIDGVRGTAPAVRDTARAYRIPRHLMLLKVALPAAMPQIMAGIRVALAVGLVLMVISEFFGADAGVGYYINDNSTRFAMRQTWAGTILVGILGYVLSALFLMIERRLLGWYFQEAGTGKRTPRSDAGSERT